MLRVLKLTLLMIACCHWMGCTWWLVSEYELSGYEQDESGVVRNLLVHNAWHPSLHLLQSDLGTQVRGTHTLHSSPLRSSYSYYLVYKPPRTSTDPQRTCIARATLPRCCPDPTPRSPLASSGGPGLS